MSLCLLPSRGIKHIFNWVAAIGFRWNWFNEAQVEKHGVSEEEAENVVLNARRSYPKRSRSQTWLVIGQGRGGRPIEIVYVQDEDDRDTLFIIHAMPLTTRRRRG